MRAMRTAFVFAILSICCVVQAQTTQSAQRETSLSEVVQLTQGFARAGEAYFSPDMKWIIFQASAKPDAPYQMYVAPLKSEGDRIVGSGHPFRISPTRRGTRAATFRPTANH
jgi:hypothetical protein